MWAAGLSLWSNAYSYATILLPSILTAPRYFAGEVEFGTITQVSPYPLLESRPAAGDERRCWSSWTGLLAHWLLQRLEGGWPCKHLAASLSSMCKWAACVEWIGSCWPRGFLHCLGIKPPRESSPAMVQVGFAFRRIEMALNYIVDNLTEFSGLAAESERLDTLFSGVHLSPNTSPHHGVHACMKEDAPLGMTGQYCHT